MTARTVVLVGASGMFGRRLARRLAEDSSLDLVLTGRRAAPPEALAAELRDAGARATVRIATFDAAAAGPALEGLKPRIVVDLAGPFQTRAPLLPRAAIQAGADYIDLADGRAWVRGFSESLHDFAAAHGRVAIAGASTTPALSIAALDHLVAGWRRIDTVETIILPGGRAEMGEAVAKAVLGWTGRTLRVFRQTRWNEAVGWGDLARHRLPGLRPRWSSLVETPDLDTLVERYRPTLGAEARAGLDPLPVHLGLFALARLVHAGAPLNLPALPRPLLALRSVFARFASEDGGMAVRARGLDAEGRPAEARWTLLATEGCGPEIPVSPAIALVRRLLDGPHIAPGAYSAAGLLDLDETLGTLARFPVTAKTDVERLPEPLFARALGPVFAQLPEPLRRGHDVAGALVLDGEIEAKAPANIATRLLARAFGFATRATRGPVRVVMEQRGAGEAWTRHMLGTRFRSHLAPHPTRPGIVEERFGPFTVALTFVPEERGLRFQIVGFRLGPLPLPLALGPRGGALESVDEAGRFSFDVTIAAPLIGRIAAYRGWLVPVDDRTKDSA